jgi:predicted ATP-dependent endonuclease of OLD family
VLILTFPLFKHGDKPLLAFIEEPELFMHPWLQRVFLEVLTKYFLTTHSNHFLDLTVDFKDVSIFTVEKRLQEGQATASFRVANVSSGHHQTLQLLGVRNSSVFLSNCTIWVEGITDRRYVAHWLRLYQDYLAAKDGANRARQPFKEDLHYSFVEYAGSNITHWSFLDETGPDVDRLCGKLFLIADSDNAKDGDAKAERQAKLGKRFHCLPAKEIENLMKPEILKAVMIAYGEQEADLTTSDQASYLDQPLGDFMNQMVVPGPTQGEGRLR